MRRRLAAPDPPKQRENHRTPPLTFKLFIFFPCTVTYRHQLAVISFGSRGIHHRIFAHRTFFRRQMPIKECSPWIYTHHEGLPIVFCPSGKIPTWIYTHHHFAHWLVEFYPSYIYPSENSPSEQIKFGLQTTCNKRCKVNLTKINTGVEFLLLEILQKLPPCEAVEVYKTDHSRLRSFAHFSPAKG